MAMNEHLDARRGREEAVKFPSEQYARVMRLSALFNNFGAAVLN
jgi:hypothetical protein